MLFDLRGRGRRRTVQVIYLTLALLLGGGLVLFGIGGDVQGGLFDAFSQDSGNDGSDAIEKQVERAEDRVARTPRDPAAWAVLAQSRFQFAGVGDGFDDETNQFTGEGRARLGAAERAWDRHLELAGNKPDAEVAAIMTNVFDKTVLNKPDKAVRAQEIVLDAKPEAGFGDYAKLAVLAFQAKQTRKGDLARKRALELVPKDQRETLKAQIDQARNEVLPPEGAVGVTVPGQSGE